MTAGAQAIKDEDARGSQSGSAIDLGVDGFERLLRGLCAGHFGGVPFDHSAAATITQLLRHLGWRPDAMELAKAMPHFPDAFDLNDVRTLLSRLGFASSILRAGPRKVTHAHLPALWVAPQGTLSIIVDRVDDRFVALTPEGDHRYVRQGALRGKIYVFERQAVPGSTSSDPSDAMISDDAALRRQLQSVWRPARLLCYVTMLINVLALLISVAVIALFDAVIPAGALTTLWWIAGGVAFALLIELTLRLLKARMIGHLGGALEYTLGRAVFRRIMGFPLEMNAGVPVSAQLAQVKQFEGLRDVSVGPFAQVGFELPFVTIFLIAIAVIAGPLVLAPLGLLLFYVAVAGLLGAETRRRSQALSRDVAERDAQMVEMVSKLRDIRALPDSDRWRLRAQQATLDAAEARRKQATLFSVLSALSSAAIAMATTALIYFGAVSVMAGTMTAGALVAVFIFSWRIYGPLQQGFSLYMRAGDLFVAFRRLQRFLTMKQEARANLGVGLLSDGAPRIQLTDITFRYPRAYMPALVGASLIVDPGETVLITGPSGAGKTTLLRIILSLYQPLSGSVSLGGVETRLLNPETLRASIASIPSRPALFHGTIAQNLRLAAPGATDAEIDAVCRKLGIADQIATLQDGLETRVTDLSKAHFSSALGPLVSFAQVLLRNPRILLVDEPPGPPDPVQESAFRRLLDEMKGKATTIVVSRDPHHAALVDKMVIMDRGRITAVGRPDQLIAEFRKSAANVR